MQTVYLLFQKGEGPEPEGMKARLECFESKICLVDRLGEESCVVDGETEN